MSLLTGREGIRLLIMAAFVMAFVAAFVALFMALFMARA